MLHCCKTNSQDNALLSMYLVRYSRRRLMVIHKYRVHDFFQAAPVYRYSKFPAQLNHSMLPWGINYLILKLHSASAHRRCSLTTCTSKITSSNVVYAE